MYFNGQLELDPTEITIIKNVKPTKVFRKLLDTLTLGMTSEKAEHETFTAVSILQQINMSLRSEGITNVIRLAIDDYDFYLDEKGVEDDLQDAMLLLEVKIDPVESENFKAIYMVLEHEKDNLKYILEISVARTHPVGEYPIKIKINGVLSQFKRQTEENREEVAKRMGAIFEDQEKYNTFLQDKTTTFNTFLDELELALRKFIKTDDTHKNFSKEMIRPKKKVNRAEDIQTTQTSQPVFYGYYGFGDYLFYSFLWSRACYNNNIYCHDFSLVDGSGHNIMNVGEEGFNAGETNTLNEEAAFEPPSSGDVEYSGDNDFQDELESADVLSNDTWGGNDASETESGWGGDWGDSTDSGSCSSCSSCGGCS